MPARRYSTDREPSVSGSSRRAAPLPRPRVQLAERVTCVSLLSSLHLGGHQTDFVDTGAMRDIDGAGYHGKFQIAIALYKHDTLRAGLEDLFQARSHFVLIGGLLVDHQGFIA